MRLEGERPRPYAKALRVDTHYASCEIFPLDSCGTEQVAGPQIRFAQRAWEKSLRVLIRESGV